MIFLSLNRATAATYTVNNASDFNNLPRLNAGDVVQLNSGTYGAINKTLESTIADDTTAKNNPILVYAVTPGGVVVNAPSKIILSGRGVTLAGLDFGPNSGIMTGSSYMVATASASRYMTLSNLRFNGCAAGANDGHWLYIQGFSCSIEFCTFTERPEISSNSTVSFMPNITEGGVTVPRLHRLSYCYFGPRYVGTVNGFESIRIGVGDVQTFDMQVTIEHNLFYRSIWRNDLSSGGEPEIISNKSKGNKILYNTILESQGGICLRSGDYGTVEGNFIFGAGTFTNGTNIVLGTTLASQNGIRVIGQNHVVRNNYIENITGTDIHAALCLMSGESDYYPGNPATGATNNGSYAPAHNALIYNNTFVNCREINLGFLSSDSYTNSSGTYVAKSPTNVLFYNNAWQGNGTTAAALVRETSNVTGYTPIVLGGSGGNYVYEPGSSTKLGWTNGISNSTFTILTSPGISSNFDNYKVPTSTSPLLNKASNTLVATYDIRGTNRPTSNQDIGCFEREVTGSGFKPLLRTNVGTGFDGGPTNSYPQAGSGDSKPTILTTTIQSASVGTAYSQTLQSSGGDGILTWSISAGSLPTGLSLLPGSGVISGTPGANAAGTYTFTAKVTDSDAIGPDSAEQSYTLTVYSAGGVKLSIGTVAAYSSASGTKSSYSYDGKTGTRWSSLVTSKNPNSAGTNFGADCTWIWWDLGENKNLSSLKLNWYNGSTRTYNYRLDSTTNTNSWSTILTRTNSVTNGLTNGYETVSLSSASGRYMRLVCWGNSTSNGYATINEVEIYGSAYAAPDSRKTQSIVFGALGSVLESDPPMALSAYSLSASNTYTGLPITYESSDPTVATVDGTTLTLTGGGSAWITASQQGDTNYQAAAPVQQLLTVTPLSPVITSATSATAVRGLPFRFQIAADRPSTGFGATGLPAGLTLDSASGKILGTATVSSSYAVIVSAQNSSGTGSATLNLNVIDPFVYETFESYTSGQAIPTVSPSTTPSGIKAVGQVTSSAGNSVIGGTSNKVAWFNDISTSNSAQLEFNGGASGQSYLAASFEIYNNATPSTSGSMPLIASFTAWNSNNTTTGGSSTNRIAALEFNQFGSLTTPAYSIKGSTTNNFTYSLSNKQTVHLFANDHDTNTINYVGPDGNVRTLSANSFAVFLNGSFIGMYGNNPIATDVNKVLLVGNNNLGRLSFNTSSGNTGNWLIDNVVVSDMPTDVVVPPPGAPTITSPSTASGQAGIPFTYTTTNLELADVYTCDGVLPTGLTFSTTSGSITGTPNQSGTFPVTIYASNDAGAGTLALTLTIAPAPPNIFSGADPSLNTAASWSLGAAPTASTSGGSYTDLVFYSSATNLTTSSGNINGKSWNVTNGSSYSLISVRDTNSTGGTTYKMGNTGTNDSSPFTNVLTGVENEMAFLTNNSSLTLSPQSISNNIPATLQLRNSGIMRIATGCTLNLPCNVLQTASSSAYAITKRGGGKLILSGTNSYTGATTVEEGTLALSGTGTSPTTIKTGAVLELALSNSASVLGSGLTLELGSQVRIIGTPASGQTYTLATASAVTNNGTLETAVSGYELATSSNSLILRPASLASPAITWSNPAAITYGTALSSTQLNATSTVAGTFVYNPTNGTMLPAGTNTLQAIFTATDSNSYVSPVTNSVTLVVNKATPVITWSNPAAITYGTGLSATQLNATSSVAGSFVYNPTIGTVLPAGTNTLQAIFTASDSTNYVSPLTNTVNLVVNTAVVSSNASLANLTLSSGSLSPGFSSNTISYSATVSNLLSIRVTPTVSQSNATVKVNGVTVASGTASGAIRLQVGTNTITNLVTAQDGATTKTYTISVVQNDAFDSLRAKWRDTLIAAGGTSIDTNAAKYWTNPITGINTNPSSSAFYLWSDLPLNTGVSGNMRDTFDRLEKMALAYANPASAYYQNASLAIAVINGLDWMVANVYNRTNIYDNWYHWMISGAQNFANAALLIYPALNDSQIASYYSQLQYYGPSGGPNGLSPWPDSYRWVYLTGSNIAEAAFVMTLNGILYKSGDKLNEGRTNLLRVFPTVTSGDGFYSDGGYIFHGNAVENGSYGLDLIVAVTNVTDLLYGSAWALAESDSSKVYSNWIPLGLMPFYYQGALMHMIRGRSYTTSGSTGSKAGGEGIAAMQGIAKWSFIPETEKAKLTAFTNSPHPAVGQYMFPSIDRVVAHRANFSFGLSLSSSRTCNWDPMRNTPSTQNNDKGWNTADGMTSLYVGSTDTHFTGNIWPTLDWYHLTGTTSEQNYETDPGTPEENWAGGAEVSGYGVAGMILHPADFVQGGVTNRSTLRAKKSYFMLEKEVICLGAGITCQSANIVDTTVENRRMGSNMSSVNLWVNGVSTSWTAATNSGATLTSPKSCAIEGVGGYYFPDGPNNLRAEFVPSTGKWTDVHPSDSDTNNYTENYLRLIFKHGAKPGGATYAYTLLPAMTPSEVAGYAYNPQTTILSNTDTVQAVKNPVLGVVAANFWDSAGGTVDLLTVNKSCSLIVRETSNSISVGIADPSQSLAGVGGMITVKLNRSGTLTYKDPEISGVNTSGMIEFTANVSGTRGNTLHATFSLAAAPVITGSLNLVGVTGTPVSYQITSDINGVTYGASGLPPGLSLYGSGLIYGTPTASGTYTATISATNSAGRAGYATLTIQVADSLSSIATTYGSTTTWVCPANVTAVQVEAWGGGGAGGSGYKPGSGNAFGGGGAGGAYAKRNLVTVVPGNSYTINVGAGGVTSITHLASVSGGESWFGNSLLTNCLAKGGAGGVSVVSSGSGITGTGGAGSSTGSLGDIVYAGGSGLSGQGSPTNTGGGGGSSAGTASAGSSASSYLGASAVTGGGAGGNGKDSSGNGNGSAGSQPGGGGGGARGSSTGSQTLGGTGGAGQVVITIKSLSTPVVPVSGPTFSSVFSGALNPTNVGSDGLAYLMKYALGGTNTNDSVTLPTVAMNGSSLTLSAIVRTNDTNLTIVGQSLTELAGTWSNLSSNPYGTASTNTNNVPAGCQRREFTVNSGTNNRTFLRLKATQNP